MGANDDDHHDHDQGPDGKDDHGRGHTHVHAPANFSTAFAVGIVLNTRVRGDRSGLWHREQLNGFARRCRSQSVGCTRLVAGLGVLAYW